TPSSNVFRDDAPNSLRPVLRMVNAAWWSAVGDLGRTVTTGETAFILRHHESFFSYLKHNDEDQVRFDAAMAAIAATSDNAIAMAYDFSLVPVVLDVGGGRGGLIRAIIERYEGVKGILFD